MTIITVHAQCFAIDEGTLKAQNAQFSSESSIVSVHNILQQVTGNSNSKQSWNNPSIYQNKLSTLTLIILKKLYLSTISWVFYHQNPAFNTIKEKETNKSVSFSLSPMLRLTGPSTSPWTGCTCGGGWLEVLSCSSCLVLWSASLRGRTCGHASTAGYIAARVPRPSWPPFFWGAGDDSGIRLWSCPCRPPYRAVCLLSLAIFG